MGQKDLIYEVLKIVCQIPAEVEIISACPKTNHGMHSSDGLMEVEMKRISGDHRPAIIYGFDSLENVRKREHSSILDAHAVFYLQLPCRLSFIRSLFQEAAQLSQNHKRGTTEDRCQDEPIFTSSKLATQQEDWLDCETRHRLAGQEIRRIWHTCNNLCALMKGSACSAENALESNPQAKPSALADIKMFMLEDLARSYSGLEPHLLWCGISGFERVPQLLSEAIELASTMHTEQEPTTAVQLAWQTAGRIQTIAEAFHRAVERGGC